MLWRNFEYRERKWWREKCTQRAVRFEWSWKEKKRRERDEMLTRTLAQWIFQRVKTLKPVSNIPASIFVLYPWRNFRSRRVRFFNRKLERNRDVRRGVTSHAPKIRDETDSKEREREGNLLRNDFILFWPFSTVVFFFFCARISADIRWLRHYELGY